MRKMIVLALAAALLTLTACGTSADEVTPEIVGSQAPGFTLDNALGGQTSLSDYAGEPVLLYFHMAVG